MGYSTKNNEYRNHFNHPGTVTDPANKITKYEYRTTSANDQAKSIAA